MRGTLLRGFGRGGGRIGIAFGRTATAVAGSPLESRRAWRGCQVLETADPETDLAELVRAQRLGRAGTTLVLASDDYRLVMVEAPDVPSAELADACRWRIRELIDFPVADAVVEVMEAGGRKGASGAPLVHVVAAHRETIRERLRQADEAGVRVRAVDIPELALRNLGARLPEGDRGMALIHLEPDAPRLLLVGGERLFMSRDLPPFSETDGISGERLDALALEVQRTLDYYESHLTGPGVGAIAILANRWLDEAGLDRLRQAVTVAVDWVRVEDLFPSLAEDAAIEGFDGCAIALGGALRADG